MKAIARSIDVASNFTAQAVSQRVYNNSSDIENAVSYINSTATCMAQIYSFNAVLDIGSVVSLEKR